MGNVKGQNVPTWFTQAVSWGNDSDQPSWLMVCVDQDHITNNTWCPRSLMLQIHVFVLTQWDWEPSFVSFTDIKVTQIVKWDKNLADMQKVATYLDYFTLVGKERNNLMYNYCLLCTITGSNCVVQCIGKAKSKSQLWAELANWGFMAYTTSTF